MIHGSAEARLSRLPAMEDNGPIYVHFRHRAIFHRGQIIGGRSPSLLPLPPDCTRDPAAQNRVSRTTGHNKSSVFAARCIRCRPARAAKSRRRHFHRRSSGSAMTEYAYRSSRIPARCLFASIEPSPALPRPRGAHASELASRSLSPRGESPSSPSRHASAGTRISFRVPADRFQRRVPPTSLVHAITRNSPLPLPFRPLERARARPLKRGFIPAEGSIAGARACRADCDLYVWLVVG